MASNPRTFDVIEFDRQQKVAMLVNKLESLNQKLSDNEDKQASNISKRSRSALKVWHRKYIEQYEDVERELAKYRFSPIDVDASIVGTSEAIGISSIVVDKRNELKALMDSRDVTPFLVNGKIPDDLLDGEISTTMTGTSGNKSFEIEVRLNTPLTVWAVTQYLLGSTIVTSLPSNYHMYPALREVYLALIADNIGSDGLVFKQRVIEDRSDVFIVTNRTKYIDDFMNLKLYHVFANKIGKFDTKDYDIKDICGNSLLRSFGIEAEVETLRDLLSALRANGKEFRIKDIFNNVLAINSNGILKLRCKREDFIDIVVFNEHPYLLASKYFQHKQVGKTMCNDISTIVGSRYKKFIVTDRAVFDAFYNQPQAKIDYTQNSCYSGSNHITFMEKLDYINKRDSMTIKNRLEKAYKLKGNLTTHIFDNLSKERFVYSSMKNAFKIDKNKAYAHSMLNNDLPVPSLTDYIEKYNGKIVPHGMYFCKLSSYDKILGPTDYWYSGHVAIVLLKEKRIVDIEAQFVTKKCRNIPKYIDIECEDEPRYLYDCHIKYIGWLKKTSSSNSRYFDDLSVAELVLYDNFYRSELRKRSSREDNVYRLTQDFFRPENGILARLTILDLVNLDLYEKNQEMELNGFKLNTVYVDSMGYTTDMPLDVAETIIGGLTSAEVGKFKREYTENNTSGDLDVMYGVDSPIITEEVIDYYLIDSDSSPLKMFIDKGKSFMLDARGGYGKSTAIHTTLIPYLDSLGKTYRFCSTTNANRDYHINKGFECQTIHSLLGLSFNEIRSLKLDYIILDEASQIRGTNLWSLNELRNRLNINVILVGDRHQCHSVDSEDTWMNSRFMRTLCDGNIVHISKHDKVRCDPIIDSLLDDIIKYYADKPTLMDKLGKVLNKNVGIQAQKLAYRNKTCDLLTGAQTVHCAQGSTISWPVTIYEIDRMPMDVLYTAISRVTKIDFIFIDKPLVCHEELDYVLEPHVEGMPIVTSYIKFESKIYDRISKIPAKYLTGTIIWNSITKKYKVFDSIASCWTFISSLAKEHLHWHEVVINCPQYMRFDVDIKTGNVNSNSIYDRLLIGISHVMSELDIKYDLVVCCSSDTTKFSRHIIIKSLHPFASSEDCKKVYDMVLNYIDKSKLLGITPAVLRTYIDGQVYKSPQNFRLVGNYKDARVKKMLVGDNPLDTILKAYNYSRTYKFTRREVIPVTQMLPLHTDADSISILKKYISMYDLGKNVHLFRVAAAIHNLYNGDDRGIQLLTQEASTTRKFSKLISTYKNLRACGRPVTMASLKFYTISA